jgi:hypothetical protein
MTELKKAPEGFDEDRREFLATCAWAAATVGAGGLALAGCGTTSSGSCTTDGTTMTVGSSGGHVHTSATVSAADVSAGAAKTVTLGTSSGHSHTVAISAANFASLASGNSVTLTSSSDSSHTHSVTISCA